MKKVLISFVAVCSIFLLTGCGSSNKLIGKWVGKSNDGIESTFTFEKKNVFKYQNEFISENEGTYEIKDDVVTLNLDLWSSPKDYKFEVKDGKLSLTATDQFSPSYTDLEKSKK